MERAPEKMAMYEITWVTKELVENGGEGSTAMLGGRKWQATIAMVIADIESGRHSYYVRQQGRNHLVAIFAGEAGKVLRTRSGGGWSDALLTLPTNALSAGGSYLH
jgi:hypothetical protein